MIRHKIYQILIIIFAFTLSACEETFVEAFGVENPSGEVVPPQYNTNFICLKTLEGHSNYVRSVAYSPDGTKIISGSEDNTIKIWDANTGECLKTLEGHSNYVNSVAFSPDGTKIISGSNDDTIKIWDANTGECLKTLEGHSDNVRSVAYSPDGTKIISGSYDNTIMIWGEE